MQVWSQKAGQSLGRRLLARPAALPAHASVLPAPPSLCPAAQAHADRVHTSEQAAAAAAAGGGGGEPGGGDGPGGGGERAGAAQDQTTKAMKKYNSTKEFVESHLGRASVLTPLASEKEELAALHNGGGATGAGEEEEEEEHHAAGMGATAVSVVIQGSKVVVANTGAPAGSPLRVF